MDKDEMGKASGEDGGAGVVDDGGAVGAVVASASSLGGLLDVGFRQSCGSKLIPLFYVLVVLGMLYTVLRTSFAVMNVAVGTGLWGLIVGLVGVLVVAMGLRIVLECLAKYLRG
jgi:small neutral amino acid transporter SnatA (MarC family)